MSANPMQQLTEPIPRLLAGLRFPKANIATKLSILKLGGQVKALKS